MVSILLYTETIYTKRQTTISKPYNFIWFLALGSTGRFPKPYQNHIILYGFFIYGFWNIWFSYMVLYMVSI